MNEQEKKTENSENLPATVDARKDLTQVSGSYYEMREQVAEMAGKNYGNLKAHRK